MSRDAAARWSFPAIRRDLCTHCGVCVAACPTRAMDLNAALIPDLARPQACTACGLCGQVCPGAAIDFAALQRDLGVAVQTAPQPAAAWLGPHQETLLAWDPQPGAAERSSSGGAITALLRHALASGQVAAAAVTAPAPGDPTRFICRWATEPGDLEAGRQAKYQVIPAGTLLRDVARLGRVAFVGPGCQVAALRKWQQRAPALREQVAFCIGYFCATGNLDYAATRFLIERGCGWRTDAVTRMEYRHGTYPGGFQAEDCGGRQRGLPKDACKWLYPLYTEPRCMACVDFTAELADVSFGDPFAACTRPQGQSAGVLRTARGVRLCRSAAAAGALATAPLAAADLVAAQRFQFYVSRQAIPRRNARRGGPEFSLAMPRPALRDARLAWKAAVLFLVFQIRRPLRWLLRRLPFAVFAGLSRASSRG